MTHPAISPTVFLRRVLALDAASGLLMGVGLLAGAGALSDLLGPSSSLLRIAGVALLICGGLIGAVAWKAPAARTLVWLVILGNAAWVIESLLAVWFGLAPLTMSGAALVVLQALVVAVFAALEYVGLKRLDAAASPQAA